MYKNSEFTLSISAACTKNNNGCSHICEMQDDKPVCECPGKGELGPDEKTCTGMYSTCN